MNASELQKRMEEEDVLYEKYARPLEKEHTGEYVAVSKDGRLIVSADDIEVLKRGAKEFGKGNFAFRRIGYRVMGLHRCCS